MSFALSRKTLSKIYQRLFSFYGPQFWWPATSRFEIMIGAILTQNTNWGNVEKAIRNLKSAKACCPEALKTMSSSRLASLIKPAGYFNVKAERLKNFVGFFYARYRGSVKTMIKQDVSILHQELLSVKGIGPETADSILLYALDKPVFVIDAYTKRIFSRHGFVVPDVSYEALQEKITTGLPEDTKMFNEYHALIVRLAKDFCRTKPACEGCPLQFFKRPI